MLTVTKDSFQKEVVEQEGVTFVDFFAEWCGPCRMVGPIIEELSKERKDIKFVKVNVDQSPDLSSEYSISSIPTFVIFKDGKAINQFSGGMGKEKLIEEINKAIS